jgi:hypothetical protein
MRTTGNIPMIPGPVVREKKVSSFKTISFLVSLPEYESGTRYSDHKNRDTADPAEVPGPRGD